MTQQQFDKRKERAENGTFVISQTDDGFRVYSPAYPTKSYIVSGSPEIPACTCADFEHHQGDPDWRCKHILAVLDHVHKPDSCAPVPGSHDSEDRAAIQDGPTNPGQPEEPSINSGPSLMVIKRSVSPDGRIDSLSVEISCPMERIAPEEINGNAEDILDLQSQVIESFLSRSSTAKRSDAPRGGNNGAIPAQMLSIGGYDSKWGRKLYIAVQANGKTIKLFGSRKQLGEALTSAGYAYLADHVNEGAMLNLACRITTKRSDDGRYTNVDRVFPMAIPQQQPQRGWRQ